MSVIEVRGYLNFDLDTFPRWDGRWNCIFIFNHFQKRMVEMRGWLGTLPMQADLINFLSFTLSYFSDNNEVKVIVSRSAFTQFAFEVV